VKAEKSKDQITEIAKAEMQALSGKEMPQARQHLVPHGSDLSSLPRQRSYSCSRSCKRVESKFSQSKANDGAGRGGGESKSTVCVAQGTAILAPTQRLVIPPATL